MALLSCLKFMAYKVRVPSEFRTKLADFLTVSKPHLVISTRKAHTLHRYIKSHLLILAAQECH